MATFLQELKMYNGVLIISPGTQFQQLDLKLLLGSLSMGTAGLSVNVLIPPESLHLPWTCC